MVPWIRSDQELEALGVAGRRAVAAGIHIAAADPLCARRNADLVAYSVIAYHLASREGAMAMRIDGRLRVLDGVVPVVVVVRNLAVPSTVMILQRGMVPLDAGIVPCNHPAFAAESQVPD